MSCQLACVSATQILPGTAHQRDSCRDSRRAQFRGCLPRPLQWRSLSCQSGLAAPHDSTSHREAAAQRERQTPHLQATVHATSPPAGADAGWCSLVDGLSWQSSACRMPVCQTTAMLMSEKSKYSHLAEMTSFFEACRHTSGIQQHVH